MGAALGAAAVMGMELIFIKRLTRLENIFQILLVNNFIGVCIASVAVLSVWQMPEPRQWLALGGGALALALLLWLAWRYLPRLPLAWAAARCAALWQLLCRLRRPALPATLNPGSNAGE